MLLAGISRTYRRVLIAGVAAATMGLNVTSVDAAGSKSPDLNTRHIHKVSAPTKPQKPAQLPLAISKAPVVVMVQLAGDPVAVVQGNSGRNLGLIMRGHKHDDQGDDDDTAAATAPGQFKHNDDSHDGGNGHGHGKDNPGVSVAARLYDSRAG